MSTTAQRRAERLAKKTSVSPADYLVPLPAEPLPGQRELPIDVPTRGPRGIIPRPSLLEFLASIDFQAFLEDYSVKKVRQLVVDRYGRKKHTRVTAEELRVARTESCQWWKSKSLCPLRKCSLLSEDQWDRIRRAVSDLLIVMHGLSLAECVRVVRTRISCNETVLRGLTKRFRVWRDE